MAARYLLDTNICIYIAKHNPPAVRAICRHSASELAMSVITLSELRFGAEKPDARTCTGHHRPTANPDRSSPLPQQAGEHYGQIRAGLQQAGLPIGGNNDLWLAAHARSEGWILVTNNEREFVRVPGLQVENW